jgi:sialic acid synthase SpsE
MTKRLDSFRIGKRQVGTGAPVFVIAEISANHNQDLETARSLIRAAHGAGAEIGRAHL